MADKAKPKRKLLGEILKDAGLVTEDKIKLALNEQKKKGMRIGQTLIDLGFIKENDLVRALAEQLNLPHIDLSNYSLKPEIVKLIPQDVSRRYELIALEKAGNTLTVGMVDPLNVFALDDIQKLTHCKAEPVICTRSDLLKTIEACYAGTYKAKAEESAREKEKAELKKVAEGQAVIDLVNSLIAQAVKERATDIHIEPDEDLVRVRYRIDGILHEAKTFSSDSLAAIVSRIKVLSGLDISEKRIPQDGRIRTEAENREIDIRISTLPTVLGEKVAMRILDKRLTLINLEKLGFLPGTLKMFDEVIKKPYGMILVTGPTSSGKSTTLYAALNAINSIEKHIITIEDPVEYGLRLVNQVQVNPRAGLTFASALRSFLRQDPNVIMVGEIRDLETAEIAIQAALTGHLVFSTIHTNNAPSTLTRLIDMKVEPFLISASVIGVLAQRLVRVICPKCKQSYEPSEDVVKDMGLSPGKSYTFYRGKGCAACHKTGYKGRTGIFEFMVINDEIRELVMEQASTVSIKEAAKKAGMMTLREEGMQKVIKGVTSVEEVVKATIEGE